MDTKIMKKIKIKNNNDYDDLDEQFKKRDLLLNNLQISNHRSDDRNDSDSDSDNISEHNNETDDNTDDDSNDNNINGFETFNFFHIQTVR